MLSKIIKKELLRVFSDRRLVISLFFIPFISIFCVYSIMNMMMSTSYDESEIIILLEGAPNEFKPYINSEWEIFDEYNYVVSDFSVEKGNIDVSVSFKENEVTVAYNREEAISIYAYDIVMEKINLYREDYIVNNNPGLKDIILNDVVVYGEKIDSERMMIAGLITTMIVSFVFSGVLSIGTDSIAGEKERQTLATILITPVNRNKLVLGKTTSVIIVALICSLSSFLGFVLSSSKIIQSGFSLTLVDMLYLLVALLSYVLIVTGVVCIISSISKSVKEANSYTTPIYLFVTILAILSLVNINLNAIPIINFIPLVNNIALISGVLMGTASIFNVLTCFIVSIIIFVLLQIMETKILNNEKTYFNN